MESPRITLQDAVSHLYRTAVTDQSATWTQRLRKLAEYAIQELAVRGLAGAEMEVAIPGGGRPKQWDVGWPYHGKYRLAISLKSILKNLAGTVPNRIDDLIGEVANAQMHSPEIVIGYLMLFDVSKDTVGKKHGLSWCDVLQTRLQGLSGRSAPSWSVGMLEAFTIVKVDFSVQATVLTPEADVARMFDALVAEVMRRNPSVR